jgi:hypothetical protein
MLYIGWASSNNKPKARGRIGRVREGNRLECGMKPNIIGSSLFGGKICIKYSTKFFEGSYS